MITLELRPLGKVLLLFRAAALIVVLAGPATLGAAQAGSQLDLTSAPWCGSR